MSHFLETVCASCDQVFELAVVVPPDWRCDECMDRDAERAVEHELARYHRGSGGVSERERQTYARDTGRRR